MHSIAVEQLGPDLVFESLDLAAKRRLRHTQALCSAAEIEQFGHSIVVAELAQFHAKH
jgi:hypothetical protein